ncbi:SusC/RagA family TonB-linked outer membrane protein [Bacteroidia bacterium]|nr:SusC/RagA family TonB-linked outer membrane protein [Bacteroidia bacterium]
MAAGVALGQSSNITTSGRVTDAQGSPVIGAVVAVEGSTTAVVTNADGQYSIGTIAGATLTFSMMGYEQQTKIANGSELNITLSEDTQLIDEVVVVGYGTQKSKDLTAPIAVIKGEELSRMSTTNVAQAMQGKVAGVQIINSGAPGAGAQVKIRGVGSIGDYAKPLYVVDGTFVENIDFLGANDIESMNVLKDASASAIYGVRAANGVVIITTRRGSYGKPSISYEGYAGVQVPVNIMPLTNKEQYITMLNAANEGTPDYVPRNAADYPVGTDWYSELLRPAAMHSHSLDVSGMNESTNYSVGLSYLSQDGIMNVPNGYNRINLRGRFETKAASWLRVGATTIVSNYNRQIANDNAWSQAYVNPPLYPVYNDDNEDAYPIKFDSPQRYNYGNAYGNPVASATYADNKEKGKKVMFSAFADFIIIDGTDRKMNFKTSYNQDYTSYERKEYQAESFVGGSQGLRQSELRETFENKTMQIIDNLLTFSDIQGKHSYTLLLGQSTRMEKMSKLWGRAVDVPGVDEQSKYLKTGSYRDRSTDDDAWAYNGLSAFARGTYNYGDKYLLSLTFRADASSKYQEKWGYFPSLGVGWVLSQEDFMKGQKVFDFLKVRASWGMLGNDNIPANSAVTIGKRDATTSAIFNDVLVDGVGAQTVVQNYLKWEVVSEYNVGVDAAFLKRRLTAEADFYYRVTDNVVFKAPVAGGGGAVDLLTNNGKVLNTGVELTVGWADKITNKLSYRASMNVSTLYNEVLQLNGRDYLPGASVRGGYATRTAVGHPIGAFYGYEVAGVYQSAREPGSPGAGYFKYLDNNDDGKLDDDDKKYLGSALPWLMGGIDLGLNYGNWDVGITLQGQVGNKILNAKRMNRDVYFDANYDLDFYNNAWSRDNHSNTYPSAEAYNSSLTQQPNSFFVEDGSYFRIQNVQIGYTTDKIKFIPRLRVYVSAQRPLTLFGYNGFSPEVGSIPEPNAARDIFKGNSDPLSAGVDNSVYPMAAVYSIGLKINF